MKNSLKNSGAGDTLRTRPHKRILPIDSVEIKDYFKLHKFPKPYSVDLVKDLCNVIGHYKEGSKVENALVSLNEMPEEIQKSKKRLQYQVNIQKFLVSIQGMYSVVKPTLENAYEIISYLSNMPTGDPSTSNEDDVTIPIFNQEKEETEKEIEDFLEYKETVDNLSDFQRELVGLDSRPVAELSSETVMMLKALSLVKSLKKLKTKGIKNKIDNFGGKKSRMMPMNEYSEFPNARKIEFGMPDFDTKLAKKELQVKRKYVTTGGKQLLYMMIDQSGSMNEMFKKSMVKAVLLNRLEAVEKGHAELYVRFFIDEDWFRRATEYKATNKTEAKTLYNVICRTNYCGGVTDIQGVIKACMKRIDELHGEKPEIMIVNDGRDEVDPNLRVKGNKVHAIILGGRNFNLKQVCIKSGGLALEIIGGVYET